MKRVIVVDRMPIFKRSAYNVLNDALIEGAKEVLINAKTRAPYKKGPLRSNSDAHQIGKLHQRISFWLEYAAYQEFGGDGKRVIRNYTTPGTGKHYLKKSGDEVATKLRYTFSKHGKRARA
jgi:hypothetical protein